MPHKRLPREILNQVRAIVWERDGGRCTHCGVPVTLDTAHMDHRQSGITAGNQLSELRTLCRRCHVLRADPRHRGMIAEALADGIIPPNWRELVWSD